MNLSDFLSGPAYPSRVSGYGYAARTAQDLPCCVDLPMQTCRRLYPGGIARGFGLLPGNARRRPSSTGR
jgi:hypothetical protein